MPLIRIDEIIKRLNNVFYEYINFESAIRKKYFLSEKDIRFTYYRVSCQTIDSAIHLLMISDICVKDRTFLEDVYKAYSITNRFITYAKSQKPLHEILSFTTGELIIAGYFSSMYHVFENAFRIICQQYDLKKYDVQNGKFGNIFSTFIKEFKNKTHLLDGINIEVYDYIQIIRNSIHNNGVYVDKNKTDRNNVLNFDNDRISIKHNQPIRAIDGVWYELIKASQWYRSIITGIIGVPQIASIKIIEDPSQNVIH